MVLRFAQSHKNNDEFFSYFKTLLETRIAVEYVIIIYR